MSHTPDLLIKNVKPVSTSHDGSKEVDIRIRKGKIAEIGQDLEEKDNEKAHDAKGSYISPGWMDMHVHLREPGYEHKETIETGCRAAAFGGFTEVACMPNTNPPIHARDVVEFIKKKSEGLPVNVHPIGCVSKDRKGESIAEMADMQDGGAVAFSDDGDPVYNSELMRVALEYSSMLGMPIINHEEDLKLSRPGHMHEGKVSTRLGLDGTPGIAEEVMIARDILLAEFTGGHVHVAHISTAKAVDLVRKAKADGIHVTTEVCTHHFDLTDEEIERQNFDTNFKMHPPLRTQEDVDAMIEGLADGTIDAICTDHAPHAIEEKEVEFIYAPNGIIGLETAWGVTGRRLLKSGKMKLREVLTKLIDNPRNILNLEIPKIEEGAFANLTLFNTDREWTFEQKHIKSKSKNSPYVGSQMVGKAEAIYNNGQFIVNE
ncbi:dihydroorotase [Balneolaceae bacterium YR4-1]|uniref:Dihydroorotase n=1 Tax=Halalkalibaculum roseum TaxID=2709311 RepID=A0A6M1SZ28_9BACT|nr:dihydroorotase [Halalkalibaculum roseum]NGP77176.1 dihydroorotase [Halalkalibaculum roseum]